MNRRAARAVLVTALAAVLCSACGVPLMKLPSGPGVAVPPDAASLAVAEATAACRAIRTLTAEVAVSGSAGGHRLRGRLSAGVAKPASARLEAVAPFGAPLFIFVATGEDATLLLPRDERVLAHGRADAVLDAVAGVPLGAGDLEAVLTGCAPASAVTGLQARQLGDAWQIATGASGDELYLHRDAPAQRWRLLALVRRPDADRAWRADYSDHYNELPRTIRVASVDARNAGGKTGAAFALQLVLSQVETNVALDASAFSLQIPPSAQPITLDELRRSGPMAPKADGK
jgi:outer membrane lipoprotein-sorting protein